MKTTIILRFGIKSPFVEHEIDGYTVDTFPGIEIVAHRNYRLSPRDETTLDQLTGWTASEKQTGLRVMTQDFRTLAEATRQARVLIQKVGEEKTLKMIEEKLSLMKNKTLA